MDNYSFLNTAHTAYFADLYDQYLQDPDKVEPSWRAFFQGFDFGLESNGVNELIASNETKNIEIPEHLQKEFKVVKLIDGYRTRGHLFTKTNPVRERRKYQPTLDIENFGLSNEDLSTVFNAGEIMGIGPSSLNDIISHLQRIYCSSIGIEYMYIRNPERVNWIQQRLNVNDNHPDFSVERKKNILKKLNQAVSFESFLHTKYVGQKRFSLEGGESLIPALDSLILEADNLGVEEFVMGMAHRGRLNTLANIFGKSTKDIFSEFDGKDYDDEVFDGDVKYHLGWTSKIDPNNDGKQINISLAPNPSHLETVGWENFLGMTVGQAVVWASQNIDPKYTNPELTTSEPYVMGSHATCSGAWVSGPEDLSPPEYFWGYNRMLTIDGLFGAGDTVGGSAHKFSSGSFTEGRLAAKAAVKYIEDKKAEGVKVSDKQCEDFKTAVYKPLENYTVARNEITGGTVSPSYISPIQGLQRLQKIMDEYVGGITSNYMTNGNMLKSGLWGL